MKLGTEAEGLDVKRKPLKKKAGGGHVNRNAQFERIAEKKNLYH